MNIKKVTKIAAIMAAVMVFNACYLLPAPEAHAGRFRRRIVNRRKTASVRKRPRRKPVVRRKKKPVVQRPRRKPVVRRRIAKAKPKASTPRKTTTSAPKEKKTPYMVKSNREEYTVQKGRYRYVFNRETGEIRFVDTLSTTTFKKKPSDAGYGDHVNLMLKWLDDASKAAGNPQEAQAITRIRVSFNTESQAYIGVTYGISDEATRAYYTIKENKLTSSISANAATYTLDKKTGTLTYKGTAPQQNNVKKLNDPDYASWVGNMQWMFDQAARASAGTQNGQEIARIENSFDLTVNAFSAETYYAWQERNLVRYTIKSNVASYYYVDNGYSSYAFDRRDGTIWHTDNHAYPPEARKPQKIDISHVDYAKHVNNMQRMLNDSASLTAGTSDGEKISEIRDSFRSQTDRYMTKTYYAWDESTLVRYTVKSNGSHDGHYYVEANQKSYIFDRSTGTIEFEDRGAYPTEAGTARKIGIDSLAYCNYVAGMQDMLNRAASISEGTGDGWEIAQISLGFSVEAASYIGETYIFRNQPQSSVNRIDPLVVQRNEVVNTGIQQRNDAPPVDPVFQNMNVAPLRP
ncbi:hypothetical protein ACFL4E_02950 [Candidatus Omnitrophota bacterium]